MYLFTQTSRGAPIKESWQHKKQIQMIPIRTMYIYIVAYTFYQSICLSIYRSIYRSLHHPTFLPKKLHKWIYQATPW